MRLTEVCYLHVDLLCLRIYDKAIPIPTQTDPINKTEHKSTNSVELKHNTVKLIGIFFSFALFLGFILNKHSMLLLSFQTQTEPYSMKSPVAVDEKKLINSLRKLAALMESEVKLGTTSVFKF